LSGGKEVGFFDTDTILIGIKVGFCTHAEEVDGAPDPAHAAAQERLCLKICKLIHGGLAKAQWECR